MFESCPRSVLWGPRRDKADQGEGGEGTRLYPVFDVCAGLGAQLCPSNISTNSQKDPGTYCPQMFCRWRNGGSEPLRDMATGMQLGNGRPRAS